MLGREQADVGLGRRVFQGVADRADTLGAAPAATGRWLNAMDQALAPSPRVDVHVEQPSDEELHQIIEDAIRPAEKEQSSVARCSHPDDVSEARCGGGRCATKAVLRDTARLLAQPHGSVGVALWKWLQLTLFVVGRRRSQESKVRGQVAYGTSVNRHERDHDGLAV